MDTYKRGWLYMGQEEGAHARGAYRCAVYIGQEEEPHARGAYRCAVCGRNGTADPLDRHHIFGGSLRKKSEKYGLTVYLCHSRCHEFGPRAAHRCRETAQLLHEYGQRKAMAEQGWTTEEFVLEFGKNYLPAEEAWGQSPEGRVVNEARGETCRESGFRVLADEGVDMAGAMAAFACV